MIIKILCYSNSFNAFGFPRRTANWEGLINLDRPYMFGLNYCKIKGLMFRDQKMLMFRIGSAKAKEIRDSSIKKKLDGYIGYQLMSKIPGNELFYTKRMFRKPK